MYHGDFRADNLFFADDGSVAAVDFQLVGTGRGAYDLAYFVTQSLAPDGRRRPRAALFDRWIAGLVAAGVPEADLDGAWEDYRRAALFCLVYPVVAWRGMDVGRSPPGRPRHHDARPLRAGGRRASTSRRSCSGWRIGGAGAYAGNPQPTHEPSRAVAQLAEQRSPKPQVGGSSPSCPALLSPQERPRPWR